MPSGRTFLQRMEFYLEKGTNSHCKRRRRHDSAWLFVFSFLAATSHVLAQQQSFRRRPEDVEVKLGETAVLRCEVDNQAGRVQWTRGGFALGFDRAIPHYGRYSMVGDEGRGIHNLRIVNVSLSDINEFQCQVGPTRTNKLIRFDARLNVLVPPTSIQILNHAPDAQITLKEKDATELECVVKESRPAATILWYRNETPFKTESREDFTDEVEVTVDGISIRKNTTRSKIRILPSAEDDRARFTCEGRHPALSRPHRVTVQFSVQYPPGAPRIDGYNEGETIRENKSVTLICISRGGNPLASLIWFKNDVQIDSSFAQRPKESRNELSFTASTKDNLVRYRCEASNIMSTTPKIADVVLTVMFPPKEVKITGASESKIGDMVTLTCACGNSNPKADLAWFKGGVPLDEIHTSSMISTDGGWTTASNVTFRIEATDRKETYTCQAVNRGLGETKSATHTIHVIQPPGHPIIYKSQGNITAGLMQRITCTSTGGHPPAALTWFRAGKKVDSVYTTDGNMATAELSFEANMTDNGIQYKCEAKNKAVTSPLSETTTFGVLFPPNSVTITSRPKKFKEGETGYLTCESSSSNPPAKVTFLKESQVITEHLNQTYKEGKHGGKKTMITLELDLTSEHDGWIYTCEAKNTAIKQSVHNSVKLDVSYKPKFLEAAGERVSVVEGEACGITVRAKGNPDSIKYKWTRNSSTLKPQPKKLSLDGPVLNFTEVNRKDKGKYEIEATNSEGTTSLVIDLDVQFPATILTTSDSKMVGQNENAHLECGVDANPLDESMVLWKYGEAEISRPTQRKFQDKRAYLTILDVNVTDAGSYFCFVNNGIGQPVNSSIFLIVKHKPDVDKSPAIAKAASNKGETGKLICRAKGAPNVTFSWNRKDGVPISSNSTKYHIHTRMLDRMNFESVLEVRNVQTEDYGLYGCIAQNELDLDSHDVKLDVTSFPDTPLRFRVLNSTDKTVTLTWDPGFDGGFAQSYNIMYFEVDAEEHRRYVDVFPIKTTTYSVGGLRRGTSYGFRIKAMNRLGSSNYTTEVVQCETTSVGPNSLATNPDEEFPTNPLSRLVISVFILVGATMLLINVLLIACFIKRRTKKRLSSDGDLASYFQDRPDIPKIIIISVIVIGMLLLLLNLSIVMYFLHKKKVTGKTKQDEASEQGSSKSATIEMYAPSSYNETVTGETLSSISEKSATYSQGEHQDDYIEDAGKGTGVSTYLVDPINHHSSAYPYQRDMAFRASTLPRHPKHQVVDPRGYAEDDGYLDSLRKNTYNSGDDVPVYGRMTPRPTSSRPPQVPPIPELYNIPPEARYVVPYSPSGFGNVMTNSSLRHLPQSTSQELLNPNLTHDQLASFHHHHIHHQPNGRLVVSNGNLSPQRHSVLTTFIPNPSPNLEHEGHLV